MFKKITVGAVFSGLLAFSQQQTTDKHDTYKPDMLQLQLEIRWGGTLSTNPVKAFTNIPASYRTVPWNPGDDPTGMRTALIPDNTLNPPGLATMNYVGSAGFMLKERFALRAGIGFGIPSKNELSPGNTGDIREVDIFSNTFVRGYGTSLVYDAARIKNWGGYRPYFIPEAEVRIGPIGVVAGGWQRSYAYEIEQGYDRYDSLQTLDTLPFANVVATHYYLGIRMAYIGVMDEDPDFRTLFAGILFTVGPIKLRNTFVPQAQGTKLQGGSGVMFDATFIFGGPVKRWGIHPGQK